MRACACLCVCVCAFACLCVCVCVRAVFVCMHACVHVCAHVCAVYVNNAHCLSYLSNRVDTAGVLYFNVSAHPTQTVVLQVIGCQLAKPDILLVSEEGRYSLKKTTMEEELVTNTRYYVSSEEELFVHVESVRKGASLTYYCT